MKLDKCPYCGIGPKPPGTGDEWSFSGCSFGFDESPTTNTAFREARCWSCGRKWVEEYELVKVVKLDNN